jgi:hypothetical protein
MDRQGEAARLMEHELEDALGEDVTEDEARAAAARTPSTTAGLLRENRLLVGIISAVALVLAAMLGLILNSAWFVVLALAVHLVATYLVATFAIKLASEVEKPDPTTVARLQADGVSDPEAALNAALKQHTGAADGLTDDGERTDRTPRRAGAQSEAMTPSSVPTELVGPGSPGSFGDD